MVTFTSNPRDPLEVLPLELTLHVMSYLNPEDLNTCTKVSTKWKEISSDIVLWKSLVRKENLKFIDPDVYTMRGCLMGIEKKRLRSDDEIVEAVKKFVGKLYPHTVNRFRCVLLGDKNRIISIESRPVYAPGTPLEGFFYGPPLEGGDFFHGDPSLGFVSKDTYSSIKEYFAINPIDKTRTAIVIPSRGYLSATGIQILPSLTTNVPHEESQYTRFTNPRYVMGLVLSFPIISNTYEYELHQRLIRVIKTELDKNNIKLNVGLVAAGVAIGVLIKLI